MITLDCHDLESHIRAHRKSVFWRLLDESLDFVFIKDPDSRFLYSNRSHSRHLHLTEAQLLGKNDLELYPDEYASAFYADETRLFGDRLPMVKLEANAQKGGKRFYTLTIKQLVASPQGQVLGLMGIARKIAATNREELHAARDQLIEMVKNDLEGQVTPSQLSALRASFEDLPIA